MRIAQILALLLALWPCHAAAQNQTSPLILPPPACIGQVQLRFYAVSTTARYGLLDEGGAARWPADSAGIPAQASWIADQRVQRRNLWLGKGGIVPIGAGFPAGDQTVMLAITHCGPWPAPPRLIRLDRQSPDHGHRLSRSVLTTAAVAPSLDAAGKWLASAEGVRQWQ